MRYEKPWPHLDCPEVMDALKVAHHELTCVNHLMAYDDAGDPNAEQPWRIDVSAALKRLEAVLPAPPWDVPGGGVACVSFGEREP
jgi:hypothetical protein